MYLHLRVFRGREVRPFALAIIGAAALATGTLLSSLSASAFSNESPSFTRWSSQDPAPIAPLGQGQSLNWAGYVARNGTFTGVTGSWTVPQPSSSDVRTGDATWVGIGGVTSRDLIQAGTSAAVLRSGQVQYEAWVETLPQPSQSVSLSVSPGDSMTVSLTQQSTNQWAISLTDNTSDKNYQTSLTYASSLSSAEWIEEAPGDGARGSSLDNFGTVSFSGDSTIENGSTVTPAQASAQAITMVNRFGQTMATPSSLGSDGASFTVTRDASTASPQPIPVPRITPGRFPYPPAGHGFGHGRGHRIPGSAFPYGFGQLW